MVDFGNVTRLLPTVLEGVKWAENLFHGPKRGKEKREAALGYVLGEIKTSAEYAKVLAKSMTATDALEVGWLEIAAHSDEMSQMVGRLIDVVVEITNFVSKYSKVPEDPKIVN